MGERVGGWQSLYCLCVCVGVCVCVCCVCSFFSLALQELLQKNASIFTEQGRALSQFASRDVKVLVVGNPANTNCLIAMARGTVSMIHPTHAYHMASQTYTTHASRYPHPHFLT